MSHSPEENRKPIGKLLAEKRPSSGFSDTRIRISKDSTFYGVTQTKSGDAEISISLKIIKKSGEQLVIMYHEILSPIRYDGAGEIKFSTPSIAVTIKGKNLEDLVDYLAEHRLMWVKEPDSDFPVTKEGEVEIEGIDVQNN